MTYPELQQKGPVAQEHLQTLIKDSILIVENQVVSAE